MVLLQVTIHSKDIQNKSMTRIIKKVILFALCMLASRTEAKSNSSLKTDSIELLKLLQATLSAMDQLEECHAGAYQASGTMQEKKRCLAILAQLQVGQSVSRRRNRFRKRRPRISFHS